MTQQVQPALSMQAMESQQAWIISQHLESPLVQVMQTPSLVDSHLHMPMVRLQQHTIMPFIVTQQEHIPPASIVHRFCTMPQAALSSQAQVIFMPPLHRSIFMVQRGTIIQLEAVGIPVGVAALGMPIPGRAFIVMPVRSIIMLDIAKSFLRAGHPPALSSRGFPGSDHRAPELMVSIISLNWAWQ
jgi:hypothetical protein